MKILLRSICFVLMVTMATVVLAHADPDKAGFMSALVWRGDGQGDYTFEEACDITDTSYELTASYPTDGVIYSIAANWSFTGEVTLEVSPTGKSKDYMPIINGVPLDLTNATETTFRALKWQATLAPGSTLTEVRISYKDTSGVVGSFGTPELSGFMFKKPIYVKGGQEGLFHYQIPIKIGESARSAGAAVYPRGVIQSDFADCRFTQADGETLLPYWLEDITGTEPNRTATFWVKIPHVPQDGIEIYLYYGKPDAEDLSNGEAVFDFFDDFRASALDVAKWDVSLSTAAASAELSYDGLMLNNATVKSAAYTFQDGIIEYKAKSASQGAIIGIIRGGYADTENRMAYSSQNAGKEHAIQVATSAKANTAKAISQGTYYNYEIIATGKNLTFRRYNADKSALEAEVAYGDVGGPEEGFIGLSTSADATDVYYDRVFAHKFAASAPAIDTVKTTKAQEEAPNIANVIGLTLAPNGNLVLSEGAEEGQYVSPLIHAPFKARIIVPSWALDEGEIAVDISAKEYGVYKEDCANTEYYYASREDFTEGENLRFRARFSSLRGAESAEAISPALKQFTLDFRPGGLKLLSPNGGEYAKIGDTFTIRWDAADYGPGYGFKLEYSIDGGLKYSTIVPAAKNTGAYSWTVPDAASAKAVARISDPNAAAICDTSNNYFSIVREVPVIASEPEASEAISEGAEAISAEEEEVAAEEERPGTQLYELLIKLGDSAGYKEGDIIMIKPKGFLWGREEKRKFLIIQAYLTEKEAQDLMQPETRVTVDAEGNTALETVKRRKYTINLNKERNLMIAKIEALKGLIKNKPLVDINTIKGTEPSVIEKSKKAISSFRKKLQQLKESEEAR